MSYKGKIILWRSTEHRLRAHETFLNMILIWIKHHLLENYVVLILKIIITFMG